MDNIEQFANIFKVFAQAVNLKPHANSVLEAVSKVVDETLGQLVMGKNLEIGYDVALLPDNYTVVVNVKDLSKTDNPLYYTSTLKNALQRAFDIRWPNYFKVIVNFAEYPQHSG